MEASNRTEATPVRKRLPREWSGTKVARARCRERNKIRQKRKRDRDRAERRRRILEEQNNSSSDEDVGQPDPVGGQEEEEDPFAFPDLEEAPDVERVYPNRAEVQEAARREQATAQLLGRYQAAEARQDDDLNTIARSFATIKVTSHVSDNAIDKLFGMFVRYSDKILPLLQDGVIRSSYSKSIRPVLVAQLLPIRCAVLLKLENAAAGYKYNRIEGLQVVPAEYFKPAPNRGTVLLRTEVYVKLKDIKETYLAAHGNSAAAQHALLHCTLSADGVKESNTRSRTFIIVTIRVGSCYYLVRMFNPLIGVTDSKPKPKEIFRYVHTAMFSATAQQNSLFLAIAGTSQRNYTLTHK